ncbi:hypothetical protein ACFLSJ_02355 [Verrucomicrobiota bacterium]
MANHVANADTDPPSAAIRDTEGPPPAAKGSMPPAGPGRKGPDEEAGPDAGSGRDGPACPVA